MTEYRSGVMEHQTQGSTAIETLQTDVPKLHNGNLHQPPLMFNGRFDASSWPYPHHLHHFASGHSSTYSETTLIDPHLPQSYYASDATTWSMIVPHHIQSQPYYFPYPPGWGPSSPTSYTSFPAANVFSLPIRPYQITPNTSGRHHHRSRSSIGEVSLSKQVPDALCCCQRDNPCN